MSYWLRSPRLGFRTWSDDDLDLARALWGDLRVTEKIGGPFDETWIQSRLAHEIDNQAHHGIQYWPIFLLSDGAHVGCCGLKPCPYIPGILELGFHLRSEHWGKGYATEAAREVIRHAFDDLKQDRLFAGHHPQNEESRRVLDKLGFKHNGDVFYPPTGLNHPSYLVQNPRREKDASISGEIET